MAYTFLKTCFDMDIGKSLFDKKGAELAPGLLEKAANKGCKIVLPCDWACGQDFCNDQEIKMVTKEEGIPDGWEGMVCNHNFQNLEVPLSSSRILLFSKTSLTYSSSIIITFNIYRTVDLNPWPCLEMSFLHQLQ